ncbi:HupE/UreJ family protein [Carnimonas bestiolae]|uniref:HupE/UreJ family protein n=1 Tax=Carnimonas bestiolae TaxID=3402172 RepID=UPI003EDC6E1F
MKTIIALLLLGIASPVFAHPALGPETFYTGFLHPLTGADHLLMLSGAGVLAALGRSPRLYMGCVLAAMVVGALFGRVSGPFPGMESVILVSIFVVGAIIIIARGSAARWAVPVLALAHGWAHGVEGNNDGFLSFGAGFVISSSLILLVGFVLGSLLRRHPLVRKLCGVGWIAAAMAVVSG